MKKSYILLFALGLTIFFISSLSAKILINEQPNEVYNLGENISLSMNFSINELITEPIEFEIFMVCDGERISDLPIKLDNSYKHLSGKKCLAKGVFYKSGIKTEENSTNEFKISNSISLDINLSKTLYEPNQELIITGKAIKENEEKLDGIVEINLGNYSDELKKSIRVDEGDFSTNFTIPSEMPADRYILYIKAYEEDSEGNKINTGSIKRVIKIEQVPTNLEIFFEKQEAIPGKRIILKPILHDQSGENIETIAEVKINNPLTNSIKKFEIPTQKNLEFKIKELNKPSNWSVSVVADGLIKNTNFEVLKSEKVELDIINKSLRVKNVGNVPYKGEVSIKIGNETIHKNVSVEYNSTEYYVLYAPEGNYSVEISNGEEKISKNNVFLTGRAVGIEESGKGFSSLNLFIWIFVIFVLGFVVLNIFEKGYKKGFVGRVIKKKKTHPQEKKEVNEKKEQKDALINPGNIACLSLSMKGEKQTSDVICLKIKNYQELISKKDNSRISIQKIINLAEKEKAYVYENNENIFFIFAPIATRTFQNEKAAVKLSKDIKNVLENHNRTAKQKIDFGIAINYGEIIAKKEGGKLYFMGVKNLFSRAKKISSLSNKEILINKDVRNRIGSDIKSEKKEFENKDLELYAVKEFNKAREENKKFIDDFVKRNKDMFNK